MSSNQKTATKGAALTVAAGLATFALQRLAVGDSVTGGVSLIVAALLFVGYQHLENTDHHQVYNDVVEAIGEDNFKELSEMSADEIRKIREQARS